MATTFDYAEELGLLRRAVAEPVPQLILVEFDTSARLRPALDELVALDPKRGHAVLKFDFRRDTAAGLLESARTRLRDTSGSRPALLILQGPDDIEAEPDAPASARFWKEMNLAREAWSALGTQMLLCVERWSHVQALRHADHLLAWAAMRIHLVGGGAERPMMTDRTALSAGLFGDYRLSPEVARERWRELEQAWQKARDTGTPPEGFLGQFLIPMLEAALSLGDLALARQTRDLARQQGRFDDADLPRWHELNLALALAGHENGLADEHARKLLDTAENHYDEKVRERALAAANTQAELLRNTAHYDLAEPLFRKSLELAEKSYGPEHPRVSVCLNNLAVLLQETNRLAEAEPLMRRALAIVEKSFGPEHPNIAIRLSNLAHLLTESNRLAEAEPLMRRALAIDEKSLGSEHPNVAIKLNNLAVLLQNTNRLAEAEPLMRRALAIDEKHLGSEHPNVAIRLNNLAGLLENTNRVAEAEPLARRAAEIFIRSLGREHPDTKVVIKNHQTMLSELKSRPSPSADPK